MLTQELVIHPFRCLDWDQFIELWRPLLSCNAGKISWNMHQTANSAIHRWEYLAGREFQTRLCDSVENKVIDDWISGFGCRSVIRSYKLTSKRNTLVTDMASMNHEATQTFVYKLYGLWKPPLRVENDKQLTVVNLFRMGRLKKKSEKK